MEQSGYNIYDIHDIQIPEHASTSKEMDIFSTHSFSMQPLGPSNQDDPPNAADVHILLI